MQIQKGWDEEMSGYKRATVTISEQEYRRLHEADMKRRFRGHTRVEETSSSTHDLLAYRSQLFREKMQRRWEHYYRDLHCLVQRLDMYEQEQQVKEKSARQWLRQSVVLADFIQEQFDHERFLPGRLSGILGRLEFAQNNLAQRFLESSLQTSQQAFLELSDLHLELEQRVLEWQAEYERAYHAISQILSELELNAKVNAFGLQGEELSDQVDVAYWTEGKYKQLLDKCRHFLEVLVQDRQYISTEELTHVSAELLPVIRENLESMVYEARLNALNSQLRMNIAERALQALEIHGFTLNEAGYINKDMRAPFIAQLRNSDGSQVTIQVLPAEKIIQELTNELVVITKHPNLKTEQEARLQWQELCRSLNQYDLNVSSPEIRAVPPITVPDHVDQAPLLNQPLIRSES